LKKLFGLGKGLESLIPAKSPVKITPKAQDNVFYVEVNKIRPNPNQPRKEMDKEGLKELDASIKKYGVLQPLLVSKIETETDRGLDVEYELIAGERRWRAAQIANLPVVPVIVKKDFDEDKVKLEVALVENLQRSDLGPLEEADAFARLAGEFKLTQKEIAEKVGKSREVVANSIRLLGLPAEMKEALRSGKISKTHARTLLTFKNLTEQKKVFKQILAGNIVVRDVEGIAQSMGYARKSNPNSLSSRFTDLEQNLSKNLQATVLIKSGAVGGSIVIKFTNLEELNKIAKTILD